MTEAGAEAGLTRGGLYGVTLLAISHLNPSFDRRGRIAEGEVHLGRIVM